MYYFVLFKAPASVLKFLNRKMRNFQWDHDSGSKISHIVLWDLALTPVSRGGLGVCNLKIMNLTMLAK